MKKFLILLIILSVISACFAQEGGAKVESISADIIINHNLTVNQILMVEGVNNHNMNTSYIYIFLSDVPKDLKLKGENGVIVNYTSFVANGVFTLRVLDQIAPNSSKTYTLSYSNDNVLQSFDENYVFSYPFTSYYSLESFDLKLFLPTGYGITRKESNTVSPPTSRLFSDGQQVIIEWVDELDYLDTNTYLVFFERITTNNIPVSYMAITGILCFFAGAAITYVILKRKRKEIVTMALTKDEKSIVDYVIKEGNEAFQNDIGKALDFSKPKLSKIIHKLEDKNIIMLTPCGRKNKIKINDEIL